LPQQSPGVAVRDTGVTHAAPAQVSPKGCHPRRKGVAPVSGEIDEGGKEDTHSVSSCSPSLNLPQAQKQSVPIAAASRQAEKDQQPSGLNPSVANDDSPADIADLERRARAVGLPAFAETLTSTKPQRRLSVDSYRRLVEGIEDRRRDVRVRH
jgi:hypothetical protein